MNIIDLYNEININTNWNVTLSSKIYENDTITITVPGCHYLFKISQARQEPDFFSGGFCWKDGTSVGFVYCYDGEGKTGKAVAQAIMNDVRSKMESMK